MCCCCSSFVWNKKWAVLALQTDSRQTRAACNAMTLATPEISRYGRTNNGAPIFGLAPPPPKEKATRLDLMRIRTPSVLCPQTISMYIAVESRLLLRIETCPGGGGRLTCVILAPMLTHTYQNHIASRYLLVWCRQVGTYVDMPKTVN